MSYASDLPSSARLLFKKPDAPTMDRNGAGSRLTWQVGEAEIDAFMKVIGGLPESISLPGGYTISRIVPLRHPRFTNLLADSAQAEAKGFKVASQWWEYYDVTVTFRTPQFGLDGDDPFLNVEFDPSGRTLDVPASGTAFDTGGAKLLSNPGVWLPGINYRVTVNNLPAFDEAAYTSYLGKVNSALFRNCPVGTVKYGGPAGRKSVSLGGVTRCSVTHGFEVSALDWNTAFKTNGAADLYKVNGSYQNPYADLSLLFR